jgi:hypothetical protein
MKKLYLIFVIQFLVIMAFTHCTNANSRNKVNIQQINPDNSNNYRYIFKKLIEEEKKREAAEQNRQF